MRGLKREKGYSKFHPFESHLLQMRGLKHRDAAVFKLQQESHLLQMRGLKQIGTYNKDEGCFVASFTDAWIETPTKHGQW